jgi:flap endonuclease-1
MGIKDLNPFIKEFAPEGIRESHFMDLSGRSVSIDTSLFFYKFLYNNERYLESFFQQIAKLMHYHIVPIYVFDGVPPKEKQEEINSRYDKKQTIKTKLDGMVHSLKEAEFNVSNSKEDIIKLKTKIRETQKKLIYIKPEFIKNLKHMLDILGIQYIQADGEADPICCQLNANGIVDMVMSDDMDFLATGAKVLLRDFTLKSNNIMVYNTELILKKLQIDYDQWVDFCILCGCDYSKRIRGLGPKKLISLIREKKCIENILYDNKCETPHQFNYIRARELMKECVYYKPEYDSLKMVIEPLFGNQLSSIREFIRKNTQMSHLMIENRLNIIYNTKLK